MDGIEANKEFSGVPAPSGDLYRALDSAQRREEDPTKHMALCLRMNQEVHNPPPAFKARQDGRLRDLNRHRVAAKTEVAL